MTTTRKWNEVATEITESLGLLPGFFKNIPEHHLDNVWQLFKSLEPGETPISNKYKALMGVAIHTETKCRYCSLFHSETARIFGASTAELHEAKHYVQMDSGWKEYMQGMRSEYSIPSVEKTRVDKQHKPN